ncbi:hypothetical protein G6O69_04155 [Pseudenhygromyxa sp. WMMC2535]|uniref:DUF6544 family protein n=1 Tax=Pseudenhygromyxa sp. WMMC2535 TaxID=2712867 RepID=UPI001555EDA5|nr:DUF6544 family protein [Pseudenhygromyxa sp. WMMC2535]NVB37010.1 hypothetical protein [Pseudenhygromyxa sp. WMMC2535]
MPLLALLTFTFAALIAGLTLGVLLNRNSFERQVDAEVAELFSEVETMPTYFSPEQLANLPSPVERFIRRNLHEGQPHPSCLRARERGDMRERPGQPWTEYVGETYLVTGSPAMLWFGRLRPLPIVWIDTRQLYLRGRAQLRSKLLSSVSTIDASDDATRRSALVQYLAELALLPPALLPGDNLRWEAIDDSRARVLLRDGELEIGGDFSFDELGNIVAFETLDRPRATAPGLQPKAGAAIWRVRYAEHRSFGELQLPTQVEAEWEQEGTIFPHVRMTIEAVEVDVPRRWGAAGDKAQGDAQSQNQG